MDTTPHTNTNYRVSKNCHLLAMQARGLPECNQQCVFFQSIERLPALPFTHSRTYTMKKHTPGPWEVDHDGPSRPIILTGNGMLSISMYEDGHWVSYENEENDAHLIAAAPELLEMLQKVLPILDDMRVINSKKYSDVFWKTRALIAKAKGES
jgi:hypothetical protein